MKAFLGKEPLVQDVVQKETRICLIRHGETAWNAELRIQGHRDLPLNETGLAQAAALAKRLTGQHFDAIYSSDLLRAQQTARQFAAAQGLPLRLEPELRERNFGCCEGKTHEEIQADDAVVAQMLTARQPDYVLPGGESLRQHLDRITACLSRLARQHAGQTLAVVSHGGVLDLIYRRVHDVPMENPRDFPLPNASINCLIVQGDNWRIESWGDTAHLEGIAQAPFVTRI
jgi:probable phosphoglycerate mutase